MAVVLYRVDDRLIHGQVVVGWGQPLAIGFVALVDDEVYGSEWEQELYRMGVPPDVEVIFAGVEEGAQQLEKWEGDPRRGIVLTGEIDTLASLIEACPSIRHINIGGIHHRSGRRERLRYVYLTDEEAAKLRNLAARGIEITAQDVPTARPVPLEEFA